MEFLQQIIERDKELFLYLNGFHNSFWDTIMLMITRQETWFPFFAVILFYIFKRYRSKSILIIIGLAVAVLLSDQLSGLLKITVQRLRPVYEPTIQHLVHNVLRKGGSYGFCSSHAANSVAVLVLTSRIFKKRGYYLLMLLWTALFCYSRIYSGVHYPGDILGGILLGWLIGYLIYKLIMFIENHFFYGRSPRIEKKSLSNKNIRTLWLAFIVLMSSVFITTTLLHHFHYL